MNGWSVCVMVADVGFAPGVTEALRVFTSIDVAGQPTLSLAGSTTAQVIVGAVRVVSFV